MTGGPRELPLHPLHSWRDTCNEEHLAELRVKCQVSTVWYLWLLVRWCPEAYFQWFHYIPLVYSVSQEERTYWHAVIEGISQCRTVVLMSVICLHYWSRTLSKQTQVTRYCRTGWVFAEVKSHMSPVWIQSYFSCIFSNWSSSASVVFCSTLHWSSLKKLKVRAADHLGSLYLFCEQYDSLFYNW